MKKQPKLELVTIGSPSISALSETEQKHFYMTLLAQILKLYKERKQNEDQCAPKCITTADSQNKDQEKKKKDCIR